MRFFEVIGLKALLVFSNFSASFKFSTQLFKKTMTPSSYNVAMVQVLIKQIYFTSVQLLPFFLLLSIIVGSAIVGVIVSASINFGLSDKIGTIIVGLVMNELAPFITVLLLALRSGAAINTEIAVMKVSRELRTLDYFHIDPFTYLYIPRVLNGMISMVLLASLFTIVSLMSGYLFLELFLHMGINLYISTIVNAMGISDMATMLIKSLLFGYAFTAVPIYRGNKSMMTYNAIPIAVLQGMIKLFVAIIIIEVLSFLRFL